MRVSVDAEVPVNGRHKMPSGASCHIWSPAAARTIEEAGQPDGGRRADVPGSPAGQLLVALEHVGKPGGQREHLLRG